jgi:peptidoglycan/LPS O-acetylase OafA/YrhL
MSRGAAGVVPAIAGRLRGLAVVLVLCFHGGVPGTSDGFLGVSLFFTLSGRLTYLHETRTRPGAGSSSSALTWVFVPPLGLEPRTCGLRVRRSDQLS